MQEQHTLYTLLQRLTQVGTCSIVCHDMPFRGSKHPFKHGSPGEADDIPIAIHLVVGWYVGGGRNGRVKKDDDQTMSSCNLLGLQQESSTRLPINKHTVQDKTFREEE